MGRVNMHSPKERLAGLDPARIDFGEGFLATRQTAVRKQALAHQWHSLEQAGVLETPTVSSPPGPPRHPVQKTHALSLEMLWDSDLAKWIEAAAYCLAKHHDPELAACVVAAVNRLAAAQEADGYLNSWFTRRAPRAKWRNLREQHELYCAGHVIEAAIALFEATGADRLLQVAMRYADHIAARFGRGPGQNRGYCGHPEIELALVRLYRTTNQQTYLDLAAYFIDERGQRPHYFDLEAIERGEDPRDYHFATHAYTQSHLPVRDQTHVAGHAVRAMYLYAAMADVAFERRDRSLFSACERLWDDLVSKQLYVTGGLGPSARNEGFANAYDLPNDSAYAETCASIGLIFWAQRMLQFGPDRRYGDVLELALFNGALSGLSWRGEAYFYENPLASRGQHRRWSWHECPCCATNIARLVGSLGAYAYAQAGHEIVCHLYAASRAQFEIAGTRLCVTQATDYPWDGRIELSVVADRPVVVALSLRLPAWCRQPSLTLNGSPVDLSKVGSQGYVRIERLWQSGDRVLLDLPMTIVRLRAHPDVEADIRCVALTRGPLVYCVEQADNEAPPHRLRLPRSAPIETAFRSDLFGGIVTLVAAARRVGLVGWDGALYRPAAGDEDRQTTRLVAIPYCLWANRAPGGMRVWLAEGEDG
jgi:uncharacterized protein